MTRWSAEFRHEAEIDFNKLDPSVRQRVLEKLNWFLDNFDEVPPLVLHRELGDFYKLRVGDWRLVYKINWEKRILVVFAVDHRRRIYKR